MPTPTPSRPSRFVGSKGKSVARAPLSDLVPKELRATPNAMKSAFIGIINMIHWLGLGAEAVGHATRLLNKIPEGLKAVTGRDSARDVMGRLYDIMVAEDDFSARLASRTGLSIKQVRELLADKSTREEFAEGMASAVMANDDSDEENSLATTIARTNQFLDDTFVRRIKHGAKGVTVSVSPSFKSAIEGLDPEVRAWFIQILMWPELEPYRSAILSSGASWSSAILADAINPHLETGVTREALRKQISDAVLALAGIEPKKKTPDIVVEVQAFIEKVIKDLLSDPEGEKHQKIIQELEREMYGNEVVTDFLKGGPRGLVKP